MVSERRLFAGALLFLCVNGVAVAADRPVAVSPGGAKNLALIEDRCPTFSWGQVEGATRYELIVFRLADTGEETKAVLKKRIPVGALSWTPSLGRCLERGGKYGWTVRATGAKGVSEWSSPSLFQVAAGLADVDFETPVKVVRSNPAGSKNQPSSVSEDVLQASHNLDSSEVTDTLAPLGPTQLSVDGNVDAASFTGDGSNLAGVTTDADLVTHTSDAVAHHLPPTSLPPSGAAGGDLAGTYPNPTLGANVVGSAEIADGSVTQGDLAFNPATQSQLAALQASVAALQGRAGQTITVLDSLNNGGGNPEITVGENGLPLISYFDADAVALKLARCNNPTCSSFTLSTLSVDAGPHSCFTTDALGRTLVAYSTALGLFLDCVDCGWSTPVDLGVGDENSMCTMSIGTDGLPVMAFLVQGGGGLEVLHCEDVDCGTTGATNPLPGDLWPRMTIGADGFPVVAYYSGGFFQASACRDEVCGSQVALLPANLSADPSCGPPAVALSPNNGLVFAYCTGEFSAASVFMCPLESGLGGPSGWPEFARYDCTFGGIGSLAGADLAVGWGGFDRSRSLALASGHDDEPVLAYLKSTGLSDPYDLAVWHRWRNGEGGIATAVLDPIQSSPEPVGGTNVSIAIGRDGLPIIAYYNAENGDLKVAHCANRFCLPRVRFGQ